MRPNNIKKILRLYGYDEISIGEPVSGYRNVSWPIHVPGETLNLILYKDEPGIIKTIQLLNTVGKDLAKNGLSARKPKNPKIMEIRTAHSVRYSGLYNYLPGSTIPWEAYTMDHLKLLGAELSNLHAAMRPITVDAPNVVNVYLVLMAEMRAYYAQTGVQHAMRQKLGFHDFSRLFTTFHYDLTTYKHLPDQQLLHMDFVRGNVLFDGVGDNLHISGILDFEKAAIGNPLFDIARTLAFLLVDCKYKSEEKIRKYFLKSGYHKRGAHNMKLLSVNDESVLENLINLFLVYDLYKFMHHNPYEFLGQNEHYIRTRDLLIKRGVINTVE